MKFTIVLLLLIFIEPFQAKDLEDRQESFKIETGENAEKIAIIGAGAGGATAAYYLQKFTEYGYNITIFEKSNYVGGRTMTVPLYDNSTHVVELGASIFVSANKILSTAVKDFGLETQSFGENLKKAPGISSGSVGIWDGEEIRFIFSSSFMGALKFLSRYKLSPLKAWFYTRQFVNKFLDDYYNLYFPFKDLCTIGEISNFLNATRINGLQFLRNKGIADIFSLEIIQSLTRVNYAQNLNTIHGIGTLVSIAANGARQVKGGNWQIFDKFIQSSKAYVKFQEKVTSLTFDSSSKKWVLGYSNVRTGQTHSDLFDKVIIAAPFHQTGIKEVSKILPPIEYVHLHVTIFASNGKFNLRYFNEKENSSLPATMLTTVLEDYTGEKNLSIPFFSVSMIDYVKEKGDYIYKVFSHEKLSDEFILEILEPAANVNWVFRKEWDSYPQLYPKSNFSSFKLGNNLWYLNEMESFISTMETSALAGANVAALISYGKNVSEIKIP